MSGVIGEMLNYAKPPGTNIDTMPYNIYILQESRAGMDVAGSIAGVGKLSRIYNHAVRLTGGYNASLI